LIAANTRVNISWYGLPASAAACALRIFAAATICMAFVICAVFFTDLIRRRKSRVLGIGMS
jgi:hypothetical protein